MIQGVLRYIMVSKHMCVMKYKETKLISHFKFNVQCSLLLLAGQLTELLNLQTNMLILQPSVRLYKE